MHCVRQFEFGHIVFIGPEGWSGAASLPSFIQFVAIPGLDGISAYSSFMLTKLTQYIPTSHALVTQWDGYITRPDLWKPEFLDYDYIGAPWYHRPSEVSVGNGGFSLRSKRLMDSVKALEIPNDQPEDSAICIHLRKELCENHGIRFAPLQLAQQFSCEYGPWRAAFGFHGMHNFAYVMSETELSSWLITAPAEILRSQHTRNLIKTLMRCGRTAEAKTLIRQRGQLTGWNLDQWTLNLRATVHQLMD